MRESEARLALAAVVEEELLAPDQIALELAVRAARPGATPVAPADGAVAALLHLVRGRLPRQLLEVLREAGQQLGNNFVDHRLDVHSGRL